MEKRATIHMLYWCDLEGKPHAMEHQSLNSLLAASEALRIGGMARFVCSSSEIVGSVGKDGVGFTGPDYKWYKRRQDPDIPLGRPKQDDAKT